LLTPQDKPLNRSHLTIKVRGLSSWGLQQDPTKKYMGERPFPCGNLVSIHPLESGKILRPMVSLTHLKVMRNSAISGDIPAVVCYNGIRNYLAKRPNPMS